MRRSSLAAVWVVLVGSSLVMAACGTAASITTSSAADPSPQQSKAASTNPSTAPQGENAEEQSAAVQTLPAPDGWKITLIPGTDKMLAEFPHSESTDQPNVTWSRPAPPPFVPSVAVDGDRVVYSALYDKAPQVYLYEISSGEVTQLTDDAPASYVEQLQVQISGDWVAWMRGYDTNDLHLRNVVTGEAKEFTPRQPVVSWRLVGGRLAWQEMRQLHGADLYLYDPAVGSVQTITAAHGLLSFDIDDKDIAWAGGADWNEYYLYDLASGEIRKVAEDSQQNGDGESIAVKGDILAWTGRTGDRTTLVAYRLNTGARKVVDEFGPFNPELRSDNRYVAWNRGEEATGTEVRVYDSETGLVTKLGDVTSEQDSWPSIDGDRVAWLRFLPGDAGQQTIMVRDLPDGPTTQLTDFLWGIQPPVVDGWHVVWARRSPGPASSKGQGIFVACSPATAGAPSISSALP